MNMVMLLSKKLQMKNKEKKQFLYFGIVLRNNLKVLNVGNQRLGRFFFSFFSFSLLSSLLSSPFSLLPSPFPLPPSPTHLTHQKWYVDRRGISLDVHVMQSKGAWYVRGLPKCKEAFSTIWGDDDMIVSMDSVLMWKPWWVDDNWVSFFVFVVFVFVC